MSDIAIPSRLKAVLTTMFYCCAVCLVISANTLLGWRQMTDPGAFFTRRLAAPLALFVIAIALLTASYARVDKRALRLWAAWDILVATTYVISTSIHHEVGGFEAPIFLFLLIAFPGTLYALRKVGFLDNFLRAFINVVLVLAGISLILWILGPIFHVITPNTDIPSVWYGGSSAPRMPGYWHLLYETQHQSFGATKIVRNTGIFPESPMYSFTLCVALLFECFCVGKLRKWAVTLLSVTILTTFASTGYVVLLMTAVGEAFLWTISDENKRKTRLLILATTGVVAVVTGFLVIRTRLMTWSGNVRIDDFVAGYKAWLQEPIFGHGYRHRESVVPFMSEFRLNNLGFSNSLMDALVRGGVVFLAVLLICVAGFFVSRDPRMWVFGAIYCFMWTITIVTYVPLAALAFSVGAEQWTNRRRREPRRAPAHRRAT